MAENINCLEGMRCPKCHYNASFRIVASAQFTVTDDGTDLCEGVEWDEYALCTCGNDSCGFLGTLTQTNQ